MSVLSIPVMSAKIAFRCDGSFKLGLGDVVSSLRLAKELKKNGVEPYFLCKESPPVLEVLRKNGVTGQFLPAHISFEEELSIIVSFIKREKITCLMLAKYDVDARLYNVIKRECNVKLLTMDFWGRCDENFNLVINWEPDQNHLYEKKEFKNTTFLLGPQYVVLPETIPALSKEFEVREEVKRVLVVMGGSDYLGLSSRLVHSLRDVKKSLLVDVVLGAAVNDKKDLYEMEVNYPHELTISENVDDLPLRMTRADLAFCAGGLTLFELLSIGVPSVAVAAYEHQAFRVEWFANRKACLAMTTDSFENNEALFHILSLCSDKEARKNLSTKAKKYVGCTGTQKIGKEIHKMCTL